MYNEPVRFFGGNIMRKEEIMEAYLDRYDLIVVYIHEQFYQGKSDTFRLRDSKGNVQNLIISFLNIFTMNTFWLNYMKK